jgi:hypothetical protein
MPTLWTQREKTSEMLWMKKWKLNIKAMKPVRAAPMVPQNKAKKPVRAAPMALRIKAMKPVRAAPRERV